MAQSVEYPTLDFGFCLGFSLSPCPLQIKKKKNILGEGWQTFSVKDGMVNISECLRPTTELRAGTAQNQPRKIAKRMGSAVPHVSSQ